MNDDKRKTGDRDPKRRPDEDEKSKGQYGGLTGLGPGGGRDIDDAAEPEPAPDPETAARERGKKPANPDR